MKMFDRLITERGANLRLKLALADLLQKKRFLNFFCFITIFFILKKIVVQKLLDYDADSDDEWEDQEGEVDECVSGDEDVEDEEDQAENDDEDDGFFVDHGHLSDDELQKEEEEEDEENLDPEERQVRMRIKAKLWKDEQDAKKKGMVPLKPLVIGPIWQKAENCDAADRNLLQKLLEFEVFNNKNSRKTLKK